MDSLLTPAELGDRLGLSRRWVRELARQGRFPHVRVGTPPHKPGGRDTRRICFTEEQAEQIANELRSLPVEVVPVEGGVA